MTVGDPVSDMPGLVRIPHSGAGFLTPVLEVLSMGGVPKRDLIGAIFKHIGLTNSQREELLPSGQRRFDNRIGFGR